MVGILHLLRKADDTPISGACVHKRMPSLAVDVNISMITIQAGHRDRAIWLF